MKNVKRLALSVLPGKFGICRLKSSGQMPQWAFNEGFCSITRTSDELSIVCHEDSIPGGIMCEKNWKCLKVEGPLDFFQVGILLSLIAPLAEARVSTFVISTYDTDYLLVKDYDLQETLKILRECGHIVKGMEEENRVRLG